MRNMTPGMVWSHCLELCAKAPQTFSTIVFVPSVKYQHSERKTKTQNSALVTLGTLLGELLGHTVMQILVGKCCT